MLAGLLVIALGFVIGAVTLSSLDRAIDVLAVARSVTAGSMLADADLSVKRIVADPSLDVLPASQRAQVVGRVAAVPLLAGSLLTGQELGAVTDPGSGQSLLAVGVKPGHFPAGLGAGASVLVLVVPSSGGGDPTAVVQVPAVVRDVQAPDASGLTVVTVQLGSAAAVRVASTVGDVTVIVQGG
jgi:hypothetical protein